MIQKFVDVVIGAKEDLIAEFQTKEGRPRSYSGLVTRLVKLLEPVSDHYDSPDPERITVIDHGDYQGTQLYIIGAQGYQPSTYWSIFVAYGSCSGCDSFQANYTWQDEKLLEEAKGNYDMLLHMVQSMKRIGQYPEVAA